MYLLNKLTIQNLKLNKKRTIVTIIGIMLSVALLTAVSSVYMSGVKSLSNFVKITKGNYHAAFLNVDAKDVDVFKENRALNDIYLVENKGYAKITSQNEGKPYAFFKAYDSKALNNLGVILKKGRLPRTSKEVLMPSHVKTDGGLTYKLGDKISFNIGKRVSNNKELSQNQGLSIDREENIIEAQEETYEIVGIMERPASEIESYSAPGYTFITYLDKKPTGKVELFTRFNKKDLDKVYKVTASIIGVNKDLFKDYCMGERIPKRKLDKFLDSLEKAKYPVFVNQYLIGLETNPFNLSGLRELGIAAIVVLVIIVLTSIYCIKNSFDISITEKTRQYGMLRSIGATKKQIMKNVFYEARVLALIGIPLGLILGLVASFILIAISNILLKGTFPSDMKLVFSFSYLSLILATILGYITVILSALKSAYLSSKISPIESIRNSGDIKITNKKIKTPKFINTLFGIGGVIAYKNIKRNKKKTRTAIISLVVSISTFIALSTFISIGFKLAKGEANAPDYDLSLILNYNTKEDAYVKMHKTMDFEGVIKVNEYKGTDLRINNPLFDTQYIKKSGDGSPESMYLSIVSIGDKAYKDYLKKLHLDYETYKDKLILNDFRTVVLLDKNGKQFKHLMRNFTYQKGDKIKTSYIKDNKEVEKEFEISYITNKLPFALSNNYTPLIIVSDKYYKEHFNIDRLSYYYKVKDAESFQKTLTNYLEGYNIHITNVEEQARLMKNFLLLVGIFLYGFIIVVSLIGLTNIFNTVTTSIYLRKREFATLKSIGMTEKEFNRMVRFESLFTSVKALLIGVTLGTILSYLIFYVAGKKHGLYFELPIIPILISVFVVSLILNLIMQYSVKKINKQNIIESIRNENI